MKVTSAQILGSVPISRLALGKRGAIARQWDRCIPYSLVLWIEFALFPTQNGSFIPTTPARLTRSIDGW